jgi:MFS family permease
MLIMAYPDNTIVLPKLTRLVEAMSVHDQHFVVPIFTMKNNSAIPRSRLPLDIYALFGVRLVVSAGSFVGPFLTMMLTMKLGYDEARAGVFMSIVSILSALGLVVGGKLGDKFNRPRVLRTLQATTALAYIACGLMGFTAATPFVIAFAMGVLNGTWPIINAIVADVAPADRRKESFSLLYWGNNIGFSIGPLIAGLLFTAAPRVLFFGNAVVLMAAAGIVTVFVRGAETPETASEAAAPTGTETVAVGMGASSTWSVFKANPVLMLYAAGSILTAFVYNQHTFALPIFLKDALGTEAGPKAYGIVMMTNGLTVVALTALVVLVSRRLRSLSAVALSSAFYAVGFGSYWFVGGLHVAVIATVVWTVGEILGSTNGNAFIAERSPPAFRSRINSAVSFCYIAGNALAPLAAGPIARTYGSASVWPFVAVCALVSAAFMFGVDRLDKSASRRQG